MNSHTSSTTPTPESANGGHAAAPRARTGPIVWGGLILTFCAWIAQRMFFPDLSTPETWLTITAIGLGVLLLGVGVVVAVRERQK